MRPGPPQGSNFLITSYSEVENISDCTGTVASRDALQPARTVRVSATEIIESKHGNSGVAPADNLDYRGEIISNSDGVNMTANVVMLPCYAAREITHNMSL